MFRFVFWLSFSFTKLCSGSFFSDLKDQDSGTYGGIHGNVMIGGLVSIHDFDGENNVNCNTSNISKFGLQRAEAMRYAVSKINNDSSLLPDLNFGIEIRDTCGSETRALDESLQFVIDRVPVCRNKTQDGTTFGVVGASTSYITAEVANLLRLFRIPLVSYAATSTGLSDQSKYDFLLRTVPPDKFQSMAMVKFIQEQLKWKSVFVLYSAGSYGEHGFEAFNMASKEEKLCVVDSRKIFQGSNKDNIKELLQELRTKEEGVLGIVCYCELPDIRILIDLIDTESEFQNFRLVGSDNFVIGPNSSRSIIFSLHYNKTDLKDFHENWFNKLRPGNVAYNENPWFQLYWNMTCSDNLNNCSLCDNVNGEVVCPRDDKISYLIDAVYSFAHALHDALYIEHKGNITALVTKELEKSNHFLHHLKEVRFRGVSDEVFFPSNSSIVYGSYDISQFDENGQLKLIGMWKRGNLTMNSWSEEESKFFGESSCQKICAKNEKRVPKGKACCWSCETCKRYEYLKTEYECEKCGKGYAPSKDFKSCYKLPIKHIESSWKGVIYLLASLGVLATSYAIKTFIMHNDTPLVKGSGRELSYLLLSGILLLFCLPFVLLVYPSSVVCGVARFGVGFFLCMCYGSLLVKTNRIARIFSGRHDLHFITPSWQIVLTIFVLMPQILINVIGLIRHPPKEEIDYSPGKYGFVKCSMNTIDLLGGIAYNIILVILCTYYAFRTRKVPANFNEARYIGFVMYTSLVIWTAFLTIYFTSTEYKTIFLILDLLMNALTLLLGLFGIKLYIIVLRPEKNSRSNSKCRSITFVSESTTPEEMNGIAPDVDHHRHPHHHPHPHHPKKQSKGNVHFEKTLTDTSLAVSNDSTSTMVNHYESSNDQDLSSNDLRSRALQQGSEKTKTDIKKLETKEEAIELKDFNTEGDQSSDDDTGIVTKLKNSNSFQRELCKNEKINNNKDIFIHNALDNTLSDPSCNLPNGSLPNGNLPNHRNLQKTFTL